MQNTFTCHAQRCYDSSVYDIWTEWYDRLAGITFRTHKVVKMYPSPTYRFGNNTTHNSNGLHAILPTIPKFQIFIKKQMEAEIISVNRLHINAKKHELPALKMNLYWVSFCEHNNTCSINAPLYYSYCCLLFVILSQPVTIPSLSMR